MHPFLPSLLLLQTTLLIVISPLWRKLKVGLNYPGQELNTFSKAIEQYDPNFTFLEEKRGEHCP